VNWRGRRSIVSGFGLLDERKTREKPLPEGVGMPVRLCIPSLQPN
jgi:hypothetical protein